MRPTALLPMVIVAGAVEASAQTRIPGRESASYMRSGSVNLDANNPVIASLAACAAERNADDVLWAYMIQSGQSGLEGRVRERASARALRLMTRGCAHVGPTLDGDRAEVFSRLAFAAWRGDMAKRSAARPIDPWADCLAGREPAAGAAYLSAQDAGAAPGAAPGVGRSAGRAASKGLFAPSEACDALRPSDTASIDATDLYARLNYRLRVQKRLPRAPAATSEKN